jgi:hypothetical protein
MDAQKEEPMNALQQLVSPTLEGGSRFGVSFLRAWKCPYEWALRYIAPNPNGGTGLVTETKARPLLVGGAFHFGLEMWYKARCTDPSTGGFCEDRGSADLDVIEACINAYVLDHHKEWEDEMEMAKDEKDLVEYVRRYHHHYGAGGLDPEFPGLRVFVDGTGPWIEREITVKLPNTGFEFSCRIDLIVTDGGILKVLEHKTTSASGLYSLMSSFHLDAQPTAELWTLQQALALPVVPQAVVLNVLNKNPRKDGTGTPPFARQDTSRTEADVAAFQNMVWKMLAEMNECCENYVQAISRGMEPFDAILLCFPRRGTIFQHCLRYGRKCDYWGLCSLTGFEARGAAAFKPRIYAKEVRDEAE